LADFAHQTSAGVVLDFGGGDTLTVAGAEVGAIASWSVDYV
jgi:hypothetical protein